MKMIFFEGETKRFQTRLGGFKDIFFKKIFYILQMWRNDPIWLYHILEWVQTTT